MLFINDVRCQLKDSEERVKYLIIINECEKTFGYLSDARHNECQCTVAAGHAFD